MHIQQLSEIDHGNKGGLGFKTKSVSSLRPAASAGITPLLRGYVFLAFDIIFHQVEFNLLARKIKYVDC